MLSPNSFNQGLSMKKLLVLFFALFSFSQLMANDISWSTPPVTISSTHINASDPRVAIDANGDAVAVWVENNLVKAATKPVNMNWSTAVTLSGTGATTPRVVSDTNGNATAVWAENGVIKAATKPFGGNWGSTTSLSSAGSSSPAIAVDAAGDVIATWISGNNVQVSTKLFGGSWSTKVNISSTSPSTPFIAIGGTGSNARAVIVWHGTVSGTNIVYTSTKLVTSGSWTTQLALSDTTRNAEFAKVAVDPSGNATALWYAYDVSGTNYSGVTVTSASRMSNGSWTDPVAISAPGMRNPADLSSSLRVDNNGNVVAVWSTSFDGDSFNVEAAFKPVRADWTSSTTLIDSNTYAYDVAADVSALGDAVALYMFFNGSSIVIQSSESDTTGFNQNFWSVPLNVSVGASNGFPRVATTLIGNTLNAVAVWVNFDGTNNHINAVTGTRSIVLPPTALSVVQNSNNFGIFTEYYNTVNWTASADPSVVGYLIYRNGVLVQQVDASVTSVVDHNTTQNGSVVYSVAAFNNQQSQSKLVNVSFP